MAKAMVKYKEMVRPIESVTLTLDQAEIGVLVTILRRIGGSTDSSPRKYADSILYAIEDGIDLENMSYDNIGDLVDVHQRGGVIYFNRYEELE